MDTTIAILYIILIVCSYSLVPGWLLIVASYYIRNQLAIACATEGIAYLASFILILILSGSPI